MGIENAPEEFKEVEEQEIEEVLESSEEIQDSEEPEEVTEEPEESAEETEQSYIEDFDPEKPTEIQQQALDMGWNPEGVPGKRPKTAEEFVEAKQFFDKISKQNREIKELREAIELMKESDRQARKRQIEDVERRLRTERKSALEDQDGDKFDEIEEELDKLRTEKTELEKVPVKEETQDDGFQEWIQQNTWYEENFDMAQQAEQYGSWYARKHAGNYTPEQFYSAIEQHVKEKFPEYFGINTKRNKPSAVAPAKPTRSVKTSKHKASDLPEGGAETMRKMVRLGVFQDEQEYLKHFFDNQ